jgi:hypothetical protein
MNPAAETELKKKVRDGYILESPEEMTEGYRKALITQLLVQGDTELISAPAYWLAAQDAPSTNTQVSAVAIIPAGVRARAQRLQTPLRFRSAAGELDRVGGGQRIL